MRQGEALPKFTENKEIDEITIIRGIKNKMETLDPKTADRILSYVLNWNESRFKGLIDNPTYS